MRLTSPNTFGESLKEHKRSPVRLEQIPNLMLISWTQCILPTVIGQIDDLVLHRQSLQYHFSKFLAQRANMKRWASWMATSENDQVGTTKGFTDHWWVNEPWSGLAKISEKKPQPTRMDRRSVDGPSVGEMTTRRGNARRLEEGNVEQEVPPQAPPKLRLTVE
uniref:Uncharacterized protein n=1 Tax=Solanum tuberosum TaxID=4113 RepID=M1D9L7_SOLTU